MFIALSASAQTIVINPPQLDENGQLVSKPFLCSTDRHCSNVPTDSLNADGTRLTVDTFMQYLAGPNPGNPVSTIVISSSAYSGRMPVFGNYNTFDGLVYTFEGMSAFLHLEMYPVSTHHDAGRAHWTTTQWFLRSGGRFAR